MSLHPKFILTADGHLRLGMVHLHRELIEPEDHCIGGGFFRFDTHALSLVLEHASYDYGPPQWSRVDHIIIPRDYQGLTPVYLISEWNDEHINLLDTHTVTYE